MSEHFDVVVVGAGISGIGAAYHLQRECSTRSFVILEGRERIGGTWDLFRYPGIRSDSDMYTLGYSFRPWTNPKSIADGPSILDYLHETARDSRLEDVIRFRQRVRSASWSSRESRWTLEVEAGDDELITYTCSFLYCCGGYYDYDHGHDPAFPGAGRFTGRIAHPQKWSPDIDYAGKKVVVIGSGATAMTLVPAMARTAEHVTMLQRSPTYVISVPGRDRLALAARRVLPERVAHQIVRWRNVVLGRLFFWWCRSRPERAKEWLLRGVRREIGDVVDVDRHFTPRYNPWDQRLCLVPDGDLFDVLKAGRASVVTDHIETFTETGIRLQSGEHLDADLIVTATGLELKFLAGIDLVVDGEPVELPSRLVYRGMMLSDVPNLAFALGYTNASWTLKADLTSEYVCRLLNHLETRGLTQCRPRSDPAFEPEDVLDFSSGYVQRGRHRMPRQGTQRPWRVYQNYFLDLMALRYGSVEDGVMQYSGTQG